MPRPIIHLDELNCLDLLSDFQENILPKTVKNEVLRHRPAAFENTVIFFTLAQSNIPNDESLKTMCRVFSLDAGEIEALAIMEKYSGSFFLTDDASAWLVANKMGFNVHGEIGIILRSIRRGQRKPEEVINILDNIPGKSSLFIKPSLLSEIMHKIKHEFNKP